MSPGMLLAAEALLLGLKLVQTTHGKGADWVPTREDWASLQRDVEQSTATALKEQAARQVGG